MKSGISFFLFVFVFESIFLVFIGSRLLIFFVFGTDLSNYSEWICIDALLHCFSYSDLIDFPNWNHISLIFNFFSLSFILPLNPHTFRLPFITYNYSSLFFFFFSCYNNMINPSYLDWFFYPDNVKQWVA